MSLFPKLDKEIIEIKQRNKYHYQEWLKQQKMFEPSNGIESYMFDGYCKGCKKYNLKESNLDALIAFPLAVISVLLIIQSI